MKRETAALNTASGPFSKLCDLHILRTFSAQPGFARMQKLYYHSTQGGGVRWELLAGKRVLADWTPLLGGLCLRTSMLLMLLCRCQVIIGVCVCSDLSSILIFVLCWVQPCCVSCSADGTANVSPPSNSNCQHDSHLVSTHAGSSKNE